MQRLKFLANQALGPRILERNGAPRETLVPVVGEIICQPFNYSELKAIPPYPSSLVLVASLVAVCNLSGRLAGTARSETHLIKHVDF